MKLGWEHWEEASDRYHPRRYCVGIGIALDHQFFFGDVVGKIASASWDRSEESCGRGSSVGGR